MATTTGPPNPYTGYDNPFRSANVSPSRIDMGVDYAGSGPIFALGPGIITEADQAWSGAVGAPTPGTYIVEHMTGGPLRGKDIYTAEDVIPSVSKGDKVDASTVIGHFTGAGLLETGYSAGTGGQTMAAKFGQESTSGDPGAFSTAFGVAFNNVLTKVGAKSGTVNPPISGTLPSGWPEGQNIAGGNPGTGNVQTTSIFGSLIGNLLGTQSLSDGLQRIGLIVFGGFLVIVGVWLLVGNQSTKVAIKAAKTAAVV